MAAFKVVLTHVSPALIFFLRRVEYMQIWKKTQASQSSLKAEDLFQ